jgi:hypothetical protein
MYIRFRLLRKVRTQSSEIYEIWEEEDQIGVLHLHYAGETVYAAVILQVDLSVTSEEELLDQLEQEIVNSYLPPMDRADFIQHVFRAELIGEHSDYLIEDDEEE